MYNFKRIGPDDTKGKCSKIVKPLRGMNKSSNLWQYSKQNLSVDPHMSENGKVSHIYLDMAAILVLGPELFHLTLKAPRKKMHLKMWSAEVVCCKYLPNTTDELSTEANSVDPEQTAPIGAV